MAFEHKELAVKLFNGVWELLDRQDRTQEENYRMVHMAHASLYHWLQVGTAKNEYVGEWQISRVYATLRNFESSLFHARRALKLCEDNSLRGFDLAYAHEAMARAYSLEKNEAECSKHIKLAEAEAEAIPGREDRDMLLADLKTIGF